MKPRFVLCLFLVLAVFVLPACQAKGSSAETNTATVSKEAPADKGYTDISVADLQAKLKNKDFTFVNVHIPFEGNIAGTDVSIPYDQIEQHLDQLPAAKDAPIVLYCRSGRMSSIAGEKLAKLGYTKVMNLEGGMVAWEQAGLPIER